RAVGGGARGAASSAGACAAGRRTGAGADAGLWLRVACIAVVAGTLIGWTIAAVPLESLTVGDWLRTCAWAAVALLLPTVGAAALAAKTRTPSFAEVLGRRDVRPRDRLALAPGGVLVVLGGLAGRGRAGPAV